jgi:hypothetical protein
VDFVDQDRHVLRLPGIRIDRLRGVAEHAKLDRRREPPSAEIGSWHLLQIRSAPRRVPSLPVAGRQEVNHLFAYSFPNRYWRERA